MLSWKVRAFELQSYFVKLKYSHTKVSMAICMLLLAPRKTLGRHQNISFVRSPLKPIKGLLPLVITYEIQWTQWVIRLHGCPHLILLNLFFTSNLSWEIFSPATQLWVHPHISCQSSVTCNWQYHRQVIKVQPAFCKVKVDAERKDMSNMLTNGTFFSTFKNYIEPHTIHGRCTLKNHAGHAYL